jgi:hypothetical protein
MKKTEAVSDSEVSRFWRAPDEALFKQEVVAAAIEVSPAYLERGRWAGYGPEYLKVGRLVRYRKKSVLDWLEPPAAPYATEAADKSGLDSALHRKRNLAPDGGKRRRKARPRGTATADHREGAEQAAT